MSTEKNQTPLERINSWIRNSVTLKLLTITILMLLLLIPASMIESIISEREDLNSMAMIDVSSKWADRQQLTGPILTIPLVYRQVIEEKSTTITKYLKILPESIKINGTIVPKTLKRGIYEVVVYNSNLHFSGNFDLDPYIDQDDLLEVKYDHAFLTIGVSDLRGIRNQIKFNWGKQSFDVEPGSRIPEIIYSGVTVIPPNLEEQFGQTAKFDFDLDLQGSNNMSFIPIGSSTEVDIESSWNSPSFNGNFLPAERSVGENGFNAKWNVLQVNRNFPQSWTGGNHSVTMQNSAFGVDLIVPLDDYQKSMRSAKYAAMTIALTFLIFFLVEILNKRKIHPFQYILVGLALCLFYILLVSITEHSNFNFAYAVSMLAVISMITLYSLAVFKSKRLVLVLLVALLGIYGFLFVTLQLADYALLLGSIGLTLILGATMYFTRNINWYKLNIAVD